MSPTTHRNTYLFDRTVICVAILSPILMVIVAGMMSEGSRGAMIVAGHKLLAAILGVVVVMRVVYEIGFMQCVRATVRRAASFRNRVLRVGLMIGFGAERQRSKHRYV